MLVYVLIFLNFTFVVLPNCSERILSLHGLQFVSQLKQALLLTRLEKLEAFPVALGGFRELSKSPPVHLELFPLFIAQLGIERLDDFFVVRCGKGLVLDTGVLHDIVRLEILLNFLSGLARGAREL